MIKIGTLLAPLTRGAVSAAAVVLGVWAAPLAGQPAPRPNVLLITADNVGFGDLGSYGNTDVQTPHLDELARQGVRCTAFYTAGATCTVSRATLLTGRYPQRIRLNHQLPGIAGNYGVGLRHYERLIPAYLREVGYATACFGKWNIGFAPGSRPTERGFDEYIGNASGNIDPYTHVYQGKHDLHKGTAEYHSDQYSTDLYADSAIDFMRRHARRPFFVYLPFDAVHFPSRGNVPEGEPLMWKAPAEYFARYGLSPEEPDEKKRYRVVMTALDDAIGRVLRALDELGLRDNTLVFFYSDNGAFMLPGRGLEVASNLPLRDGGVTLWEGGIRVPAIVRWPAHLPTGQVCAEPLISLDVLPMLLQATGAPWPQDRVLDGEDPTATLAGRARSPHEGLYWEATFSRQVYSAVRWGQYKLIRPDASAPFELYDLINDVGESRNLADQKPHLRRLLEHKFLAWLDAVSEEEP